MQEDKLTKQPSFSAAKSAFFQKNSHEDPKDIKVESLTIDDIWANTAYYRMKKEEFILINGQTVAGQELIKANRKKLEEKISQLND